MALGVVFVGEMLATKEKFPYLLFDFDGTLCDDFEIAARILVRLCQRYGYRRPELRDLANLRKSSSQEVLKYLRIPWYQLPFIVRRARKMMEKEMDSLEPISGIEKILPSLANNGYRLGILTSNSERNVARFLKRHRLEVFDSIHSKSSLFGKARSLRKFMRQRKIHRERLVYVGDETRDIEAAKKAQIRMIAVSWGFNAEEALRRFGPDYLVSHPEQLGELLDSLHQEK